MTYNNAFIGDRDHVYIAIHGRHRCISGTLCTHTHTFGNNKMNNAQYFIPYTSSPGTERVHLPIPTCHHTCGTTVS
jgi:hypothetical protein